MAYGEQMKREAEQFFEEHPETNKGRKMTKKEREQKGKEEAARIRSLKNRKLNELTMRLEREREQFFDENNIPPEERYWYNEQLDVPSSASFRLENCLYSLFVLGCSMGLDPRQILHTFLGRIMIDKPNFPGSKNIYKTLNALFESED